MLVPEMGQGTENNLSLFTKTIHLVSLFLYMHCRPIHDAIDIGALDIVESLVQHGADPTAELGDKTPLYLAKTTNHPQIYDYLLRKPCTMQ